MKTEFAEFVEMVVEKLRGMYPQECQVETVDLPRINDVVSTGLCVRKGQRTEVTPVVHLDKFYDAYKEGVLPEDIVKEIVGVFEENEWTDAGMESFDEFETVKDRIIYRLISIERNYMLLKNVPYVPFCDLAVVFYVLIKSGPNGEMAALVHKRHMTQWDVTADELMEIARRNTPRLLPVSVRTMREVMHDIARREYGNAYDAKALDDVMDEGGMDQKHPMFVITNVTEVYGASGILYPGVLNELACKLQDDLIILPSSRHEMLVVPCGEEPDFPQLRETVRQVNEVAVEQSDILSDQIYLYHRDEDIVSVV